MLRGPLRLLICLAVGILLLAGCSGSHEPSRDTTLGPPDIPMFAEARQKNEVGSEFFARYYIVMMNWSMMSLDSGPLRDFSRHCRACESLAGLIDAKKSQGDTRVNSLITVDSMSAGVIHGNAAEVAFRFVETPFTTFLPEAPTERAPSPSEKCEGRIAMTWDDAYQRWAVTDLRWKRGSK